MKRVVLSVALLALCANPLAAQDQTFEVTTSMGTYTMAMTIVDGTGEKVAHAAEAAGPERDGVMFLEVPGQQHVLRTEHFEGKGDVTRMVPADKSTVGSMLADTTFTSRWNTRKTGSHTFVSNIEQGESEADWASRHTDGYFLIASVYAPEGKLSDRDPARTPSSRSVVSTGWTDTDGVEHEVVTRHRSSESKSLWLARHRRIVAAFAEALQPRS